jgi:glucose-1-phosphatase
MIKTIILDLGKVIVPFDFGHSVRLMQEVCPHSMEELRRRLFSDGLVADYEMGLVESEDFVQAICQRLDLQVPYERFCSVWCAIFEPDPLLSEDLLIRLRRRYRLLLLSNTNDIHYRMLRRTYRLLDHFDGYVLSHEVKAAKPAPAIYHAAINMAQCAPGECFFTDDILENVVAARRCGLDAEQFLSREKLEEDLRGRGVEW